MAFNSVEEFSFLKRIGRGAKSEVFKALHKPSGEVLAVKVVG